VTTSSSGGKGPSDVADYAELAATVVAAVLAVPGVAGLHTGAFGEVATYLPGRRVNGVQLRADATEVHVVLTWGAPVLATADAVRLTVSELVHTRVDVCVEDVVDPRAGATG
jgi:uncharacterized alkaline shock family protein YloU